MGGRQANTNKTFPGYGSSDGTIEILNWNAIVI
jgi:hypothetical protein